MKLSYHSGTDSLNIDLCEGASTKSREVSKGIVLDYDAEGNLAGIDIDNASRKARLDTITLSWIRAAVQRRAPEQSLAADRRPAIGVPSASARPPAAEAWTLA